MFTLKVTEDEIKKVLDVIELTEYPNKIALENIAFYIFGDRGSYTGEIEMRKVRLCIVELRKRGYLIIAKRGYSMAGDDPEPVIHFINGMYSRAHSLTTDADIMYHGLKHKYGDAVSAKVEQLPKQPMLDVLDTPIHNPAYRMIGEPPFRKSIDARGNEIALQFEEDA